MTAILGISAFYHDSAAALLIDGTLVAAAQEERFTRKKNDASFPARSIAYVLQEAGIKGDDVAYVATRSRSSSSNVYWKLITLSRPKVFPVF